MTEETRNLTDADVKAIADAMEERMVNRFYNDLGRGVWGLVWKAVVLALCGVAAAGAFKGIK